MRLSYIFLFLFILLFNCKKNTDQTIESSNKTEYNVDKNHAKPDPLSAVSEKEIESWKAYSDLAIFLNRFDKISPNQALNNSLELKDVVSAFKDSIKPSFLNSDALNSRINVLENEVLRLTDMTYISAIKAEEINNQVSKILIVFGSINQKINTVYAQRNFEEAVKIDGELSKIKLEDKLEVNKKENTKNLKQFFTKDNKLKEKQKSKVLSSNKNSPLKKQ